MKTLTVVNPYTGRAHTIPRQQVARKIRHLWGYDGRELVAILHDCKQRSELFFA